MDRVLASQKRETLLVLNNGKTVTINRFQGGHNELILSRHQDAVIVMPGKNQYISLRLCL